MGTTERSPISTDRRYAGLELSESREPGKILFTSVRKFKGLEANAILITDISLKDLIDLTHRRLLYVGASCARDLLMLAVKNDVQGMSAAKAKREIEKMLCVRVIASA